MSSDNTLLRQYRNGPLEVEVGVIKSRWSRYWVVFTDNDEDVFTSWEEAIKVAYGERTP